MCISDWIHSQYIHKGEFTKRVRDISSQLFLHYISIPLHTNSCDISRTIFVIPCSSFKNSLWLNEFNITSSLCDSLVGKLLGILASWHPWPRPQKPRSCSPRFPSELERGMFAGTVCRCRSRVTAQTTSPTARDTAWGTPGPARRSSLAPKTRDPCLPPWTTLSSDSLR